MVSAHDREPSPERTLLALVGISKRFGPVVALEGVDLELRAGEVHALVGENGAGKSTLIRIAAGALQPDQGTVAVRGQPIGRLSPRRSRALGIAVLHQQSALFGELSVAENLFLGSDGALIDWRARRSRAREILSSIGTGIDPDARCGELGVAEQKEVEIARSLLSDAPILVLDEPTAVLPAREAARLLSTIVGLRERGVGILYISHRLEEVEHVADRITVLRDGRVVWAGPARTVSRTELVRHMVGRDVASAPRGAPPAVTSPGPSVPVLSVKSLSCARLGLAELTFELGGGEILGLGGLVGAGRSELAACLFGLEPVDGGSIELLGRSVRPRSPGEAIALGIALVPEDRARNGLVLSTSVRENAVLPWLARLARAGWLARRREEPVARRVAAEMQLRAPSLESRAGALSGGNQQKLALGKWLVEAPRVLILDEPTQGIDVAGRAEIHERIRALAAQGVAILLISSDLGELLALSDRVAVLRRGRLAGTLGGEPIRAEDVLALALGVEASGA